MILSLKELEKESKILFGKFKISYHKNFRSLYNPSKADKEESVRRESQRLKVPSFKWKENCMICGKPCDRNHRRDSKSGWYLVAKKTNDESKRSETVEYVYDRVMEADKLKNDIEMIARLNEIPNKDLVAYDARYHRGSNKMHLLRYTELSTVATI